mmetsp:Transcript_50324/g.73545  ORF Transcript_50324/g.73545 Transcript_50324/m.73545 type:complete len:271 (-) Transcript_50324:299-1111(-)
MMGVANHKRRGTSGSLAPLPPRRHRHRPSTPLRFSRRRLPRRRRPPAPRMPLPPAATLLFLLPLEVEVDAEAEVAGPDAVGEPVLAQVLPGAVRHAGHLDGGAPVLEGPAQVDGRVRHPVGERQLPGGPLLAVELLLQRLDLRLLLLQVLQDALLAGLRLLRGLGQLLVPGGQLVHRALELGLLGGVVPAGARGAPRGRLGLLREEGVGHLHGLVVVGRRVRRVAPVPPQRLFSEQAKLLVIEYLKGRVHSSAKLLHLAVKNSHFFGIVI